VKTYDLAVPPCQLTQNYLPTQGAAQEGVEDENPIFESRPSDVQALNCLANGV